MLHLIEDTHAVRDACSLMQISYSAAWNMLNRVEDELGFPLVIQTRDGANISSSILTEKGSHLMNAYDRFPEDLGKTAKVLYGKFFGNLPEANTENR